MFKLVTVKKFSMARLERTVLFILLASCCLSCSASDSQVKSPDASPTASLGSPCVPFVEESHNFPGYAVEEVSQDTGTPACGGNICLAYHFQGRVTCPYGQTDSEIATLRPAAAERCRLPDSTGKMTQLPVDVFVKAQRVDRRADRSVYCSCECSGTDKSKTYCTCPTGMQCEALDSKSGVCVRTDALYDPLLAIVECSKSGVSAATDCGNGRKNP